MKYRIIELTEDKLNDFSGKIVQVIKSEQKETIWKRTFFENYYEKKWVLTCLVEVENE